jgi:hypothetical protein
MVNYADYFTALGFGSEYYDTVKNQFETDTIIKMIKAIQDKWKNKYPFMDFKTNNLRFDSLVNFNYSFTNEMEFLNMEPK